MNLIFFQVATTILILIVLFLSFVLYNKKQEINSLRRANSNLITSNSNMIDKQIRLIRSHIRDLTNERLFIQMYFNSPELLNNHIFYYMMRDMFLKLNDIFTKKQLDEAVTLVNNTSDFSNIAMKYKPLYNVDKKFNLKGEHNISYEVELYQINQ